MENFQKLDYILDTHMNATEVTQAFGFKSETMLSKMRKGKSNISKLHLDGLEKYFNIPPKIFSRSIKSKEEIDELLENYAEEKDKNIEVHHNMPSYLKHANRIFKDQEKLFNKLQGLWYGYVYPSNPASAKDGIWEVKTIIGEDYSVIDEPWGNKGYLQLGKNESLIIKESYDHEDLTLIRFSNRQVPSGLFRFVIVSNQNHTLHEIVNFGFFSRKQYSPDEAKEILGELTSKQLKLDLKFNERLIARTIVPQ